VVAGEITRGGGAARGRWHLRLGAGKPFGAANQDVRVPALPTAGEVTMTSATAKQATGPGRHQAEGSGLVGFAAILLLVIGCFNTIDGIAAIINSKVYTANARYVWGDLRTWGWFALIFGILQLLAAAGVMTGNQVARWFAAAVVGLNAINQMFFMPGYPFWSLSIIAMDVVALWGLLAYGGSQDLTA
jgi:hypothetical protein